MGIDVEDVFGLVETDRENDTRPACLPARRTHTTSTSWTTARRKLVTVKHLIPGKKWGEQVTAKDIEEQLMTIRAVVTCFSLYFVGRP